MTGEGARNRVLAIVGTRPEVIKMAPVIKALRERPNGLETRLVLTGQHDELVTEALDTFSLVPDWDLRIMAEGQSLTHVGTRCLDGLAPILEDAPLDEKKWRPDLVLVQGDTASVLFGALSAFLHQIPIGHVEAGLRTGDLQSPFPEEGFRHLVSVVADLHFAPTKQAKQNLLDEGIPDEMIHVTGNTVVDAVLDIASRKVEPVAPELRRLVGPGAPPFILLTAHRRESFGRPLERIFEGVKELVGLEEELEVIYPVHPSPNVKGPAHRILGGHPRIHLLEPLSYPDLLRGIEAAACVLTDSGGIQEEAPSFGTRVLVLRDVTERPEGIDSGLALQVGTDRDEIVRLARQVLSDRRAGRQRDASDNPYGKGHAAEQIAELVEGFLEQRSGGKG